MRLGGLLVGAMVGLMACVLSTALRAQGTACRLASRRMCTRGFAPKTNVIQPSKGTQKLSVEKFLMMYTCKLCKGRNAQMVSKVAYQQGMVVSTCRHCKQLHLIADNEGKLDMGSYGKKIEDYLVEQGERVQKVSVTDKDLQDNYLVDKDGELTLLPRTKKNELPPDASIVEMT